MIRRRPGFTVLEVLIACTLFFLALALVCDLAVMGMRNYTAGLDQTNAVRSGVVVMDRLNRELLHCVQIYSPTLAVEQTVALQPGNRLVLRTADAVVAYHFRDNELVRYLYEPGYHPAKPGTQVARAGTHKILSKQIRRLALRRLDPARMNGADLVETNIGVDTGRGGEIVLTTSSRLRN